MFRSALALVALIGWATMALAQPTFTGAGVPTGYNGSVLSSVSADGQVAVGRIGYTSPTRAGRWTAAGYQNLGTLNNEILGSAGGVSADGSIVFGYVSGSSTTSSRPFRWTAATGMVSLGVPTGYDGAQAWSASADGTAAVAIGIKAGTTYSAMRWTATGGFQTLPMPAGAGSSFSQAMSADGGTVVGQYLTAGGQQAFRWTAAGGTVPLSGQPNTFSSSNVALGVSANGSVIVGSSQADVAPQKKTPFIWSEAGGFRALDLLPGAINGSANAVSADGGVVVGLDGQNGQTSVAWVYDAAGMRDLNVVAAAQGVDLTDWKLVEANAITGNDQIGYTIVGTGEHGGLREGFVLSGLQLTPVPEPSALLLAAAFPLIARRWFQASGRR